MSTVAHQEEAIFDVARRLKTPEERRAYLDSACDEPQIRARVEALLTAGMEADRFFADGKAAFAMAVSEHAFSENGANGKSDSTVFSIEEQTGTRIGRYKLLQKIGEGGCGAVYMAEQEEPVRRRVALKIIKLGMDTKNVIARFEAERQALAMMDHPNIARVLDAGATDTGRPYFVMELVRGVRITEFCDQSHQNTGQRLELFVQICHAIQHAHQKGIIHRDIKPSNILVTLHDGVPVPKVIDFGIAKATEVRLTDKTLFTAYEQIVGTPAYMSPEQAEMSGLDIDTRTDIYSLGVLLYELLTGTTPFDAKELMRSGLFEMRRTLRETEPHKPSTKLNTFHGKQLTATAEFRQVEPPKLKSLLRGDLDWIVMKSLEKDRRRRYETANGLAMDIQRHLNNEPVLARPPSRWYRMQKLVRRNKAAVLATAAVALTLMVGFGVSTWLFFREREARQEQIQLRQEAELARANENRLRREAETREKITQAVVLLSQDRHEEADSLVLSKSAYQPSLEGARVFRELGEWYALRGDWKNAAERFDILLEINGLDGWSEITIDSLKTGTVLAEMGDNLAYEKFRQATISRYDSTDNGIVAERTIKTSLLLPADEQTMAALGDLAKVAEAAENHERGNDSASMAAWETMSLSLLEYRRGDHAKAAELCRRCLDSTDFNISRNATAHVILAMAAYKMELHDRALSELAQGREMIRNKFASGLDSGRGNVGFWFDWIFARILLREAELLIEGPPLSVHGSTAGFEGK
jgi:serine/threonine protein kinase